MNNFKKILSTNILLIFALIPMVIILNSVITWNNNPILWIIISILSLILISYIQSKEVK